MAIEKTTTKLGGDARGRTTKRALRAIASRYSNAPGDVAVYPDRSIGARSSILEEDEFGDAIHWFVSAKAAHRHFKRQTCPPTV